MGSRYLLIEVSLDAGRHEVGRYPVLAAAQRVAEQRAWKHDGVILQWHTYAGDQSWTGDSTKNDRATSYEISIEEAPDAA